MRTWKVIFLPLILLLAEPPVFAAEVVFFEEAFDGLALDPMVWRTEVVANGPRWCYGTSGDWSDSEGWWLNEGQSCCYDLAVRSPYGSLSLSDGLMHTVSNGQPACVYLVSRLPGGVALFPSSGDFTVAVRMRFDRVTSWDAGLLMYYAESTEPIGSNPPALRENIVLQLWGDPTWGIKVCSALSGQYAEGVAYVQPATEFHEFTLECIGTTFTLLADGRSIYGPVDSSLRPTALWIGNPALACRYPSDWSSLSVDYIRVELPRPVPVESTSWGAIKALHRGPVR